MRGAFFETMKSFHLENTSGSKERKTMRSEGYSKASANNQLLSNKQVVAIFVLGIVMLFVAFWAGLSVIKGSIVSSSNQTAQKSSNLPQQQKPAEPPKPSEAAVASPAPPAAQSPSPEAGEDKRYTVRVAAFGTQEKAEELKNELRKKNYLSAHVEAPTAENTLYHVNVGPFKLREEAQQVANELSIEGKKVLGIFQNTGN
jgi:cell division septation protein DedD